MTRRRKKRGRRTKPVKVPERLHSALLGMQREVKKKKGMEPSLGELVEQAFEEDPVLREYLQEDETQQNTWDEEFMKL